MASSDNVDAMCGFLVVGSTDSVTNWDASLNPDHEANEINGWRAYGTWKLTAKKASQPKFQLDKMDKKQFVSSLEDQKDLIQHALAQAESCSTGNAKEALT